MEGLQGLIHRRNRMVRLDFPQENQHLLLQRLRRNGHHGGQGQFPRQLAQHEPQVREPPKQRRMFLLWFFFS